MNANHERVLVTGAAGRIGAVGRTVTHLLLRSGIAVRALVRQDDERSAALRAAGAEVVIGDLFDPLTVYRAVKGCQRIYFGLSVSAGYLDATITMAAAARELGVSALVNMSQMTVSEMSFQSSTSSPQHRQHWLGEQALVWSALPVATVRPTMFMESLLTLTAATVRREGRISLPFGSGKTSPVAAADVAHVVATILTDPTSHLGRIYELTGPRSQDLFGIAREFSAALGRDIVYVEVPPGRWEQELRSSGLPDHLVSHLVTMGELHRAGRYDRLTSGVLEVTGRPAMSIHEFVSLHADDFGAARASTT